MQNEPAHDGDKQIIADPMDAKLRQWTSTELLDGQSEAIICHAGEVYRLRRTRNNKLILHK